MAAMATLTANEILDAGLGPLDTDVEPVVVGPQRLAAVVVEQRRLELALEEVDLGLLVDRLIGGARQRNGTLVTAQRIDYFRIGRLGFEGQIRIDKRLVEMAAAEVAVRPVHQAQRAQWLVLQCLYRMVTLTITVSATATITSEKYFSALVAFPIFSSFIASFLLYSKAFISRKVGRITIRYSMPTTV